MRIATGAKAASLWSVQLTQNVLGYFPTDNAACAGGYGANMISSRVEPLRAEEIFVEQSIKLADYLFA